MRRYWLPIVFILAIVTLIAVGVIYTRGLPPASETSETPTTEASPGALPSPGMEASPAPDADASPIPAPSSNPNPDLATDESGLSKATVLVNTSRGLIKFKFYPQDAPNTVKRIIELVHQGFYNGLTWHRVVPGFVAQGGDPLGNGTGGSGQKLAAEFNNRRHIEGTVAMARGGDRDSADSQFYITLGTYPHLDRSYTVFGQVVEGIDVARKLQIGDKIEWMAVQ